VIASGNTMIAEKLREMADVLAAQHEDGYRVAAYRRAAETVAGLEQPIDEIVGAEGLKGLLKLPGIGRGIGAAIVEIVTTGRWSGLDRLTGNLDPVALFQTVAGIGPALASRIVNELHVDTLEQLEQAGHDGRLEKVPGVGRRRAQAIQSTLSERLGHRHYRPSRPSAEPPIDLILDVDREYRAKSAAGTLRRIAPKRFNPSGEEWLPVLHTHRSDWQFTALYSNTERAHELGKIEDWVVIYFHTDNQPESQVTVVTETHGPLAGRRVVRGHEGACIAYYAGAA
jgi:hypothetical protein